MYSLRANGYLGDGMVLFDEVVKDCIRQTIGSQDCNLASIYRKIGGSDKIFFSGFRNLNTDDARTEFFRDLVKNVNSQRQSFDIVARTFPSDKSDLIEK